MMRKVHISIVLDRSGSMEEARVEAVRAVNTYLRAIASDATLDARLSVVIFDSQGIDTIRDRVPVRMCPELTVEEYQPRGATPLLDAVGYSVGILDCLSDLTERRIMIIMTDGLENASREYTRGQLKTLLGRKQKEDGWLILYLGAGHDSWSQASQIGISAEHTADFSLHAFDEAALVLGAVGRRFLARPKGQRATFDAQLTRDERRRLKDGAANPTGRASTN